MESTKKNTNKGSKDGNKGQGSSLLLFCPQFLVVYFVLSNLVMMTKK